MTEEVGLQMFPEKGYWRCRLDVQRQTFLPCTRSVIDRWPPCE